MNPTSYSMWYRMENSQIFAKFRQNPITATWKIAKRKRLENLIKIQPYFIQKSSFLAEKSVISDIQDDGTTYFLFKIKCILLGLHS